jgi:DNA-binding transcriptional MocR family regulator
MSLEATKSAWKLKLKSSQKLVILSLADRADSNNFCFPSIARLTKDTCLNRKTVLEAIRILQELGYIEIEKGLGKVNKYILNLEKAVPELTPVPETEPVPKTVLLPVPETVLPSPKNGSTTSTENGTLTYQDNLSTNLSVESTTEQFARFWKEYPKKKSKGTAEKAFLKIKPDSDLLNKIIDAVKRAAAHHDWKKDGGKYIPHPATWLNAKGWDDELTKPIDKHNGFAEKNYQDGATDINTLEWIK